MHSCVGEVDFVFKTFSFTEQTTWQWCLGTAAFFCASVLSQYIFIYIYIFLCIYKYIFKYIYIYVYRHLHAYIYIYIILYYIILLLYYIILYYVIKLNLFFVYTHTHLQNTPRKASPQKKGFGSRGLNHAYRFDFYQPYPMERWSSPVCLKIEKTPNPMFRDRLPH